MAQYFGEELQVFKQLATSRNLQIQDVTAKVSTEYHPGTPGTHGSTPDIKPSTTLVQKIRGQTGEIEIELQGEIIPTENGLHEKVRAYFDENGYVTLADDLIGPSKLTNLEMSVTYRSSDNMKAASFILWTKNIGGKVFSGYRMLENMRFDEAFNVILVRGRARTLAG